MSAAAIAELEAALAEAQNLAEMACQRLADELGGREVEGVIFSDRPDAWLGFFRNEYEEEIRARAEAGGES